MGFAGDIAFLQNKLGLSEEIICFDMNEGCSGYVQGLYLASALIASGQCHNVLVLAGDTISKITDTEDRATRLIFGDAGTASIISQIDNDGIFLTLILMEIVIRQLLQKIADIGNRSIIGGDSCHLTVWES